MKLEEAIKVLQELEQHPMHKKNLNHKAAVKLGIEALKRAKSRRGISWAPEPLLPSETEE